MQLVTRTQLRNQSRVFADERPGGANQFLTDAEIDILVNLQCAEDYDLCVLARPEMYLIEQCITLAEPAACICGRRLFVQMPTCPPFYEMGGVEIKWADNDIEPIPEIRAAESYRYENSNGTGDRATPKGYVFGISPVDGGQGFYIAPYVPLGVTLRIRYVPPFPKLGEADCCGKIRENFNSINGWDKAVALGVAVQILGIRGKGPGIIGDLRAQQVQRLETMARERSAQEPRQVRDVFPEGPRQGWPLDLPRPV